MKRILAAFLILLANLVLLVHAVIPHHHHSENLCFDLTVTEQSNTETCCSGICTKENHPDDPDKESDCCTLSHIIALFNGDIKQNIRAHISSHDLLSNVSFVALEGNENSGILNPRFFIEIVFNDQLPIYHSLASKAFGLRGPPFVG
ncbi:hypothetical protein D1614_13975 [Maribellus luteus]|uniref:Uncharacterized protein n=1 Tax=Maribellus luteus TaxID=2305463 RepID=A0A399SYF5_9BACT|nr:DUF6769 family protein [Maribellus luteus]RIJ47682.1 hypothetical protein D1614_13975 [Maribellus luteus]